MKKFLIPLLLAIGLLPQLAQAQTHYVVPVGQAQETFSYVPTYAYYSYSFAQFIYHANQVGIDGVIDNLQFHVDNGGGTRDLAIYMTETSHSSFSGGYDALGQSYFQQVFSGSVSFSSGWVSITLDSTFTYQDTADLIICVIDNTGSWISGYPNFSGSFITTGYHCIYDYNDEDSYSLASPPTGCSSSQFQPYIRLGITSTSLYCAQPSDIAFSGITGDQATVSWHENGAATQWEVIVSDAVVTDFTSVVASVVYDTNYTVYGLSGNTLYYVYVRAVCSATDYSGWTSGNTFRSACVGETTVPYSTGFEDLATGDMPNCWQQIASGSSSASTFPGAYVYSSNARNGNVYFEFESSSGETEIAALPEMDNINQLQLSFYASLMNANFMLEVGVMEDTVFVPVDTVDLTVGSGNDWHGSYYPYTVYFNNYTGSGTRIAMRVTSTGSYTLMMDDFVVDYIPSCPPPTNLNVDSVGVDWLALHWTETGTATSWVVEYHTSPIADSLLGTGIGTTQSVLGIPATTLSGLDTATYYFIYVYSDCGEYSTAISTSASTLSGLPTSVPYFCTFEQYGSNGWDLINGSQANQWVVDSATSNGGSRSLYISNDNGTSNAYTVTSTSYVFAVRSITLPSAGEYTYSYDWKAQGESSYDFIRAALVPASVELTAGSYNDFDNTSGMPSGSIALDGAYRLNGTSSWTTQSGNFRLDNPGTYQIVFMWRNDGSVGTQPPAAIDNVSLRINSCPVPYGLVATDVQTNEVTLTWHPGGSESQWEITYGDQVELAYDTTYTIYGLTPDTTYCFYLRAVCGSDDSSNITSVYVTTPASCPVPINLSVDSVFGDTVYVSWNDTAMAGAAQLAYGLQGFNPDTVTEGLVYLWGDSTYMFTGLAMDLTYDFYVRADCGDEYSNWSSPVSAITGWHYNIPSSGIDTLRGCGYTIYDDGGPDGSYSTYCDGTVVIFPSSADSLFQLWGTLTTEGCCDYLYIYDGVGTSGTQLFYGHSPSSGTQMNIGPFTSNTGAFTIRFTSDVSVNYSGFELHTACMAPPQCAEVLDVDVQPGVTSALLVWNEGLFGSYNGAEVEYKQLGDTAWTTGFTTTEHYGALTGLDPVTSYVARVIATCDEGNSIPVEIEFATGNYGCAEIDTANSSSDTIGNGTSTYDYLPSYSFYNYSLTQQVFTPSEIGHGGSLTAISVMPEAVTSQRTYEIYMAHTNQSSLSSFVHPADMVRVYDGAPLTLTPDQWVTFQLDSPFNYNGSENLLVCFRDITGSYTSGNYWYVHSTSHNSVYVYSDGGAYDPYTTTGGTSTGNRNNMIFDFLACAQTSTCPAPVARLMAVDGYSATVVWGPGDVETSWDLYYRLVGDSSFTSAGTTTNTTHTFTGLIPNSEYEFKIQAPCATGIDGAALVRATTTCGRMPLPFTQDFEAYSGTFNTQCWYTGTTSLGTTYPYPTVVNLTGDPNKLLLLYNGAYVILPEMDAPLNQLQVRFNFVQGGDSVRLIMGVMEDPTAPIANIHVIDTLIRTNYDTTSAYVYIIYPLDGIEDTAGHLAFWDAFNDNYSFLDNIVIEYIPNCPSVTEVTAASTSTNSASVSWAGVASATSYIVEYGPRGFAAGTGATVSVTGTSTTLTGLAHSTTYEVYVYAVCGASNDTSIALSTARFTTECDEYISFPYVQNFENIVDPGDASTNIVPNCWASTLLPAGAGHEVPHVFYNTDLGHAPSQQYCFYFEGIGIAALPEMGVPLDSLYITFHEWNSDPSTYGLIIGAVDGIDSNFASTFQPIDTIPFMGIGNEFNVVSFLNGYTGTSSRIAIASYNAAGNAYADQYLDNLVINRIPNCIAPQRVHTTLLTNVAADLAWTFSNAPNYSIEYGVHGFTPGTGTTVTSTTNSVSLTGLTAYTQYDVYLVSLCSTTEHSDTTFFTFTTLRAAPVTTLPYICDFSDSAMAFAWEPVNGTQTNGWYVGSAVHYGTNDNQSLYISNNSGVSNSYTTNTISFAYTYRTFDLSVGSYNISYNWQAYGESNYDYIRAWLAPADAVFTPGLLPDGSTSAYSYTSTTPAGWIPLDGGSKLNLQSSWQTFSQDVAIATPGNYHLVFMWANDGSGGSNPPAAIDNVEVYLNTCPAPQSIFAASVGTTTIDLDWVDLSTASNWQVEYGPTGYSRGSSAGTLMSVSSHPVHIYGLDTLANYDFYVRPICDGGDTGRWSLPATLGTSFCDNSRMVTNSTVCNQTTSYFPGYATYNYSYTEVIIDSAVLAGLTDISAWAFKPQNTTASTYYTNCTVYMANTTVSDLSNSFIQDTATFVKVFTGDLSFSTTDWQIIQLDTIFTWDGHSNIVIAVDRRHGSWTSSGSFDAYSASSSKARYIYQDGGPYNIGSISGGTSTSSVPIYRLISCGDAGCRQPNITSVTHTYENATVTWNGTGTAYEVNIKESSAANWPATDIAVSGNSYTFTGLQPATYYTFRVRQDCSADSLGYSEWTTDAVLTDSLPCLPPINLHATTVTNATATLDWTPFGVETMWDIHVWFTGGLDSIYTVSAHPATVGGFTAGLTYNASVRPLCGSANNIIGDWSDTVTFSTATCPDVTGLTASNVTTNSVTLNWTANPMAQSWTIEYGFEGFNQGTGTTVTANTNSYVVTGLLDESSYEFFVKANCGTDWTSENWVSVQATTQSGGVVCDAPTGINTTVADNAVTVNWTPGTGNISYEIEYGPRGFSHGTGTTTTATTAPAVISNLDYETSYDLYVRAICDQNTYSAYSIVATFTTGQRPSEDCEPVSNLVVDEITDNTAFISWTPAEGTDRWHVVVADPRGNEITDTIWDEPSIGIIGLEAGTNYMVRVRTYCGDDNYSAYVSTNFRTTGGVGIGDVNTVSCTIYPNPTTSSTTISVSGVNGKVKIEVVDMNGRVVSSDNLECSSDCVKTMDVDRLAQGAYFVRITGESVNMVRKLIVR